MRRDSQFGQVVAVTAKFHPLNAHQSDRRKSGAQVKNRDQSATCQLETQGLSNDVHLRFSLDSFDTAFNDLYVSVLCNFSVLPMITI